MARSYYNRAKQQEVITKGKTNAEKLANMLSKGAVLDIQDDATMSSYWLGVLNNPGWNALEIAHPGAKAEIIVGLSRLNRIGLFGARHANNGIDSE